MRMLVAGTSGVSTSHRCLVLLGWVREKEQPSSKQSVEAWKPALVVDGRL
jgi:hypothetical protein